MTGVQTCALPISAGCHIVLFTTGRGTPFGTFVPTVKISTNTDLYNRKPKWIDFDAGTMIDKESLNSLSDRFIKFVIDISNGTKTNNEKNRFREISIFKKGITL